MNKHTVTNITLLILIICAFASSNAKAYYQTMEQQRISINAHSDALLAKWSPLLYGNFSIYEVRRFIELKKDLLKSKIAFPFNEYERTHIESALDSLERWPLLSICQELAGDIKRLQALNNEGRLFDMPYYVDTTPLRNLRANIESSSCFQQEQADIAAFAAAYPKYMAGLAILGALFMNQSALAFGALTACGAFYGIAYPQQK